MNTATTAPSMQTHPSDLIGLWREPAFSDLAIKGLTVFFDGQPAVFRVSLNVSAGESLALMGPNGAGKSTLIRALSTLQPIDEGEIVVGGRLRVHEHRTLIRSTIGLVAHEPMLYAELSARENLRLWAELYGVERDVVEPWLEAVALQDALDRPVGAFSRGMKQRLAIARALIHQPTLVLFDEVLTGLDRASREVVWQVMETLRDAGRIVVAATHQFEHPGNAVSRGIVMRAGRVIADQSADMGLGDIYADALSGRSGASRSRGAVRR